MEKVVHVYLRGGTVYLQPIISPTDFAGNWVNLGGVPGAPIVIAEPSILGLSTKIPEAFSYSIQAPFTREEVDTARKAANNPLLKLLRVKSYKQFQIGTSQITLVRKVDKIEGIQGYPDEKNRGWTGRGNYEDRLFFDAPFNYEEIAEAVLKHLLNPANRYPEE